MMLDHGVTYKESCSVKDAVDIAVDNGWNIVRLRVYNDPGNSSYEPSKYMTAGYLDSDDVLALAQKAKVAGLKVLLTFHYSDYWTDPGNQSLPHDWSAYNETQLKTAVYDFTRNLLVSLNSVNALPDYVAIGNEVNCGLLFGTPDNYTQAYYCKYDKFAGFFNQGAAAVREVSPESKVVLHLTNPQQDLAWLFDELKTNDADYDIIGFSYYPYWTDVTASEFVSAADGYASSYGKKVMVMETGYNWSETTYYGDGGQLEDNGPYDSIYGTSPEAQRNYLMELANSIKKSESVIGYLYWDPLTVKLNDFTGMTNSEGPNHDNGTVTQNSSLFDFEGNRLSAWDAFKYNN
ncbi:MAG: glycosyl hydrolase 53 family protein [Candidatus Cryptobacteroides sp.]